MQRFLKQLLAVLDGTPGSAPAPGVASARSPAGPTAAHRGQSLVEMTLILPILIIMFTGLVEIGWLANNFLLLLDVTREAGRFGSTLDPLEWPTGDERNLERLDCDTEELPSKVPMGLRGEVVLPPADTANLTDNFGYADGADPPVGFYDGVACTLLSNMDPLFFDSSTDDIVISAFSYAVGDFDTNGEDEVRVTGRFPARSNECPNETYDPFDLNRNGVIDGTEDANRSDSADDLVRGFVMTGNHMVSGLADCLGSEFTTLEIEEALNALPAYEVGYLPNNGLLLVEIFWNHQQLLGLPWFTILGDNFELHVWSMFPLSSAEPTATP